MGAERRVSLFEASRFWWRLGWVSFGGPAGQIALLHHELVEQRRWLSERRYLHALNFCMLLPGPEATQLATYLGWLMHGWLGGVIAGVLFLLPSALLLSLLAWLYALWGAMPWMEALFAALKPAVLAIVIVAAWRLGRRTLRTPLHGALALVALLLLSNAALKVIRNYEEQKKLGVQPTFTHTSVSGLPGQLQPDVWGAAPLPVKEN